MVTAPCEIIGSFRTSLQLFHTPLRPIFKDVFVPFGAKNVVLKHLLKEVVVKVAVIGSRGFSNVPLVSAVLQHYDISCIVSGGAQGADTLARNYAQS